MTISQFKKIIWDYYRDHKRPMPWRRARDRRDPYRVLVSEIMLQQTQVGRVVGFYENFIKKFPNFRTLARAKTADVLKIWQGLGYNRRVLALQKLARGVVAKYGGRLPREKEKLVALPGIGDYTAGAIRAFAFNEPEIFIETNIRRVFIHFFFPRRANVTDATIRRYIERSLDRKSRKNPRDWYFALMDYGAMLGETARTAAKRGESAKVENPNRRSAHYARQSKFIGSDREVRGKILRELLAEQKQKGKISAATLVKRLHEPAERISRIVIGLEKEGFILKSGRFIMIH